MSAHMQVRKRRAVELPAPELVTLTDDPSGPYADSPEGWWTRHGGALDRHSGVVYIPRAGTRELRPCSWPLRTTR